MPISQSKPESQPEPDRCQVCNQPLPATGAGEVCPACLVADALAPLDSLDGESLDQAPAEHTSSDKLAGTSIGPDISIGAVCRDFCCPSGAAK